jgi:carbon storage regulator CsrA
MLVLERKEDERLTLTVHGITIEICVCQIREHAVRIGVEAPREVRITRSELPPWSKPDAAV